jgi:hypothetical protein
MDVTEERAHRAWRVAERIKRLSDDLIPLGPWGIGLDGVLAWIPGANTLYSLGAGGLLVYEGFAAGASPATLIRMGVYLAANSAMTEVPIVGWAMDTLFRGHFMAARALQKDIEARFGAAEMPASWARPRKRRLWSGRSLARS